MHMTKEESGPTHKNMTVSHGTSEVLKVNGFAMVVEADGRMPAV